MKVALDYMARNDLAKREVPREYEGTELVG